VTGAQGNLPLGAPPAAAGRLPRHKFKCHVCGREWAPYGVTGPGFPDRHPAELRGRRLRYCALGGECEVQAIVRTIRAFGLGWSFLPGQEALRARVEAILGLRVPDPWGET
jgi:hypothetical protein